MKNTVEIKKVHCSCGKELDSAWNKDGATPSKGDFSACLYCGALYVFDENLEQIPATIEESLIFSKHPMAQTFIKVQRDFKRNAKV